MLVLPPLGSRAIIAPVLIDGCNLSIHHTNKGSGMARDTSVLTEHMGSSNDMGISVIICSTLPSHSPGYSQFARINSSTVKCSLVLCQFTKALGWKYSRIASASCRGTASQNALISILEDTSIEHNIIPIPVLIEGNLLLLHQHKTKRC